MATVTTFIKCLRNTSKQACLVVFLAVLSFVGLQLASSSRAYADVNNFTITSFESTYDLTNKDKQGHMRVTETMDVVFTDNNHGIERAVPTKYKKTNIGVTDIQVSSSTGTPSQFTTYKSGDTLVLRIGDPNSTVTGKQSYTIAYSLQNVISFYETHDELYWNINGNQWRQPFEKVKATVITKQPLQLSKESLCYTGIVGSMAQNCKTTVLASEGKIVTETLTKLKPGETLTVVHGFTKNYFTPVTTQERLLQLLYSVLQIAILPLITFVYAYKKWQQYGKDPKGRGIIAQYSPPKDVSVAEAGALLHFASGTRELTATIVDLAIKKYIKIIEETKVKKLRKDELVYTLELTNNDTSKLKAHEREILTSLFSDSFNVGATVHLADLQYKLYGTVSKVNKMVSSDLKQQAYFRTDPAKATGRLWLFFFFTVFVSFAGLVLYGPTVLIGLGLSFLLVIVFTFIMPARTQKGVDTKEHVEGIKLYINVAEKDRINTMQSPGALLASNAHIPRRTVELFEKLLPYAILFNIEEKWASYFKDIYKQPPEWFSGTTNNLNTLYLAHAISSGVSSSVVSAYSAPASSSSSGFSGGGGGGGGGGGW